MASLFSERQQGNLPSTLELNPRRDGKEHCKAITLRSGKIVETNIHAHKDKENSVEENDKDVETSCKMRKIMLKLWEILEGQQEVQLRTRERIPIEEKPNLPYPQRLRRMHLDQQFDKFMEIFKKLHINIPFSEALEQIPRYVKFLKDILAKKMKLGDYEPVALSEECNAIL